MKLDFFFLIDILKQSGQYLWAIYSQKFLKLTSQIYSCLGTSQARILFDQYLAWFDHPGRCFISVFDFFLWYLWLSFAALGVHIDCWDWSLANKTKKENSPIKRHVYSYVFPYKTHLFIGKYFYENWYV